ncbi:hypothetical protein [Fischerella thermalis]|uniref:hypothetical protein n=1 Tax=Fischerella thermalis TaxID=372787 RepID=UPI00307DE6D7
MLYQVRLITYDIILMWLGIGQKIFPITHYQLPITGLHRYDQSLNGHDIICCLLVGQNTY